MSECTWEMKYDLRFELPSSDSRLGWNRFGAFSPVCAFVMVNAMGRNPCAQVLNPLFIA